jgi:hypothetical protein
MLFYLNVDPRFDRIHSDPRFKTLIHRVAGDGDTSRTGSSAETATPWTDKRD